MMEIFKKKRGAVTVFLVIILVPIIALSSIFVDISRVKLAESVVNSAGDLTLNTILSQYDSDLNEFYGLMGSSQSIDEFLDTAEDYFTASMTAQGVETSDAQKYANQLKNILSEDTKTTDFLQISLADEGAFEASKVKNGSLANPALVKTQIVEFMKYRSPVNGALLILDKLRESKDSVEVATKDADLVDKKQEFYEKESKLIQKAYDLYLALKKYDALDLSKESLIEMQKNMKTYKDQYFTIHESIIRDLYNTQAYRSKPFKIAQFEIEPTKTDYSSAYMASDIDMDTLLRNMQVALVDYEKTSKTLENAMILTRVAAERYNIQYWMEYEKIFAQGNIYVKYETAAKNLCEAYALLKNAKENSAPGVMEASYVLDSYVEITVGGTEIGTKHFDELTQLFTNIKKNKIGNGDYVCNEVPRELVGISEAAVSNGTLDIQQEKDQISAIATQINGYYKTLDESFNHLTNAADAADDLVKLVEDYEIAKKAWKGSADEAAGAGSDLGTSDQEEISKLENDIVGFMTVDKVNTFISRVNNIKGTIGPVRKGIQECTYNSTPIKDLWEYEVVKSISGADLSKITHMKNELNQHVKDTFHFVEPTKALDLNIKRCKSPKFSESKPKDALYEWIIVRFDDMDEELVKNGKKAKEAEKENGKEAADAAKEEQKEEEEKLKNTNHISKENNLPSKAWKEAAQGGAIESGLGQISEFVKGLVMDPKDTLMQGATDLRDDIYVVDYINSMFSHDTFENEGKYDLLTDDAKKDIKPENISSKYSSVADQWKSEELKDNYNKTLTNKMINSDNNWSYENEIEYILYGKSNGVNKGLAYGSIFGLRCGFNAPAMFSRGWNPGNGYDDSRAINNIAHAVLTATQGIVPVALTKTVIIIALILAESARDLQYLRAGIPVLLIKKADTLFIKYNNPTESSEKFVKGTQSENEGKKSNGDGPTASYSDYLTIFLFMSLQNDYVADGLYARTADAIQANMAHTITDNNGYAMDKAQVYFKIDAKTQVSPLMLELPINSEMEGNIKDLIDWRSFNYTAIRGY